MHVPPLLQRRPRALHEYVTVGVILVLFVCALIGVRALAFPKRPIHLVVNGQPAEVPHGSDLAAAERTLHLNPKAGALLSVKGHVLAADRYPGTVLVDGNPRPGTFPLRSGARITTVNGKDQTEPTAKTTHRVLRPFHRNPQFYLEVRPGIETVTKGSISHEVAARSFKPTGPPRLQNAVALTFDDGPSPRYTPQILAILARYHVRANFFDIGTWVQHAPSVVADERHAGMIVGNHTFTHPDNPPLGTYSKQFIRNQMTRTTHALVAAGALRPRLFRPPGGSHTDPVVAVARSLGMRTVLWSVDPRDWVNGISADQVVATVLSELHPGVIIDFHDGGGYQDATVAALPRIIEAIRARGLQIVPVIP